jgi:hypothetical protein
MEKLLKFNRDCEAMELDIMTKTSWDFLSPQQQASLDVLLTINVNALKRLTKDMTRREKNIVCNMFVANLNNATIVERGE